MKCTDNSLSNYCIDELQRMFYTQEVIIVLVSDYSKFCEELLNTNDETVRTIASCMSIADDC